MVRALNLLETTAAIALLALVVETVKQTLMNVPQIPVLIMVLATILSEITAAFVCPVSLAEIVKQTLMNAPLLRV